MLVAAENGALPRGKVGGVGDVIRDLPLALAAQGWDVSVVTPSYGIFNELPGATKLSSIPVNFAGSMRSAALWRIPADDSDVTQLAIEHPLLSPNGPGEIYSNDSADRPFATDATRFAFFCAAVAALVDNNVSEPDVIHLHDWHAALYLLLRAYGPSYKKLQRIHTVYTIHNLALQGIRPLAYDESSLATWFPELQAPLSVMVDPRYADCVNPMAVAIRLADKINTVSPTYASEILRPSDPERGFSGGEGLEHDLQQAASEDRLTGILNGCEYTGTGRRPGWSRLLDAANSALNDWDVSARPQIDDVSRKTLATLPRRRPAEVFVSVGRLTMQKAALFLEPTTDGPSALETILANQGKRGVLIMLGSGDAQLEQRMGEIAAAHKNFLFLCGFSEILADMLYRAGDIFLMPSSFEPCGISQMLAMRTGQPCIAHAVGGLKDTIRHDVTGFLFKGDTPTAQADNFVASVLHARQMKAADPEQWQNIRKRAAAERFSWKVAAKRYEKEMYEPRGS